MEAMPTQFRRNSWSCQKASSNHRLLDNLPWAGGVSLGDLDVPCGWCPEDKTGARMEPSCFC